MSLMSCAGRPTGMCWALARFVAWAWASGPYCTLPVIRADASIPEQAIAAYN